MVILTQNNPNLSTQVKTVAERTGLNDFVIEKDWYVTEAIGIVSNIENDLYDLVFQGGTSLAKAHGIIERMSEDCDFRIRLKSTNENQSKTFRRKILREFRHDLVTGLRAGGFEINDDDIRVCNEGQFMNLRVIYPSIYPLTDGLKPFIALEFFLGDVKSAPEQKSITTLIQTVLGEDVAHPHYPMLSVAIIETAAEKWVGLTRRVARV